MPGRAGRPAGASSRACSRRYPSRCTPREAPEPMRPSKRAVGLLLGAGILFLIGTNVQAGWLYVLAALLLGALAAGLVLPFAALRGLSIELVVPDEAEQGMPTIVELRVTAPARGVRRNVTVRDTHLEPVDAVLPPIRRRERIEVLVDTARDEGDAWTPLDRCCSVAASVLDAATAHGQGARLIAARPGIGIDVLPRADRPEMFRWLANLQPSGIPLEGALDGL